MEIAVNLIPREALERQGFGEALFGAQYPA